MEIIAKDTVDPEKWDEQLKRSEYGTIFQSTAYAQYLSQVQGRRPLFIQLLSEGNVVASALVFISSPCFSSRVHNPGVVKVFRLLSKFKPLYWSVYGPVAFSEDRYSLEKLVMYIRYSVLRQKGSALFTAHPLSDRPEPFIAQGFRAQQMMTCIIDLRQDFEALKKNMDKKSALKNAQRSLERGVEIHEINRAKDFETYYELQEQSRSRVGIRPYTRSEVFGGSNMIRKGLMRGFIAVKGRKRLAGIMISTFNGYLNEWGAAQAWEDISEHLYGNDLLRYHIIEWGHQAGYRFYDQSGISTSSSSKELGIFRFKTKWGGEIVNYNSYTLGAP